MNDNEYPTAWLDLTRVGQSNQFTTYVPIDLRGTITTGDLVWVADDSVNPRLFRIKEIFDAGHYATYELAEPAHV